MIRRAIVLMIAISLAATAHADDPRKSEAKRRFEKGLKLYDEGRFADALALYQSAYELYPSVSVLFNLGLVREKVNDFEGCAITFGQFLKQSAADDPGRERAELSRERCRRQARIQVKITSLPQGAATIVDGITRGRTPARLELAPGAHTLAVEYPGYLRQEQPLTIEEGVHPDLDFVLEKLSTIAIESDVAGARVELDGKPEGPAPVKREVVPGLHRVRLSHDGYNPVERELRVAAGDQMSLMLSLSRLPRQHTISLELGRSLDSTVRIDGYPVGAAPVERRVTSGAHRVEIASPRHRTFDGEVQVPEDRDLRLRVELAPLRSKRTLALLGALVGAAGGVLAVSAGFGIASTVHQSQYDAQPTAALGAEGRREAVVCDATLGVGLGLAAASLLYYVLTIPKQSRVQAIAEQPQ